MNSTGLKTLAAAVAGACLTAMLATPASAAGDKCRATVAKESAKLTQAIAKILQKCDQGVLAGKVTGPCPDSKSATGITKAKDKLKAAINKVCTGAVGHFALGRCPAADGGTGPGTCTDILIDNNDAVADCLSCLADENASEMLNTVVYSFDPSSDKAVSKCQATIGKSVAAYYITKSKSLAKCQAGVLGGKVTGPCPDAATAAAIQASSDKKDAAIAKACCGPDGTCGGGQCVNSPANVVVKGCTGAGTPAACCTGVDQGNCDNTACTAAATPFPCCTGAGTGTCSFDTGSDCEQTRNCFRCISGPTFGAECQTNGECGAGGRCANGLCSGGTNPGQMCERNSDCLGGGTCDKTGTASLCSGGTEAGKYCLIDADCAGGGTCDKAGTSYCQSDDYRPVQDLGFVDPCPGTNVGTGTIGGTVMGQTIESLLACVDGQAGARATCQDKAGATFAAGSLDNGTLSGCSRVIDDCTSNGGTVTATISVASTTAQLGGLSVSLGFPYDKVQLPGAGSDAVPFVAVQQNPFTTLVQASDSGDTVAIGATPDLLNGEFFTAGQIFVVTFNTCGAAPTAADFACVVQGASDTTGTPLLSGVSCSVTVP